METPTTFTNCRSFDSRTNAHIVVSPDVGCPSSRFAERMMDSSHCALLGEGGGGGGRGGGGEGEGGKGGGGKGEGGRGEGGGLGGENLCKWMEIDFRRVGAYHRFSLRIETVSMDMCKST